MSERDRLRKTVEAHRAFLRQLKQGPDALRDLQRLSALAGASTIQEAEQAFAKTR